MNGRIWSEKDLQYLKDHYENESSQNIAKKLKRDISSVYNKAHALKLYKSDEFKKSPLSGGFQKGSTAGSEFRFKAGHEPKNKGIKQVDFMSKESIEKSSKTRFKPGLKIYNEKHDGAISIRTDNRKKKYQYIRISKAKWLPLHIHLWIQTNGEIPKGGIVRFKDGNTMNCVIQNLELIDKAANMKLNTIHRYPDDVKEVIRLTGKLKRTILKKEENGKK